MKYIWKPEYGADDLEVVSEEKVFDNYFQIFETNYNFKKFDGNRNGVVNRVRIHKMPASTVLIINPEQQAILLIEQARHATIGADLKSPWVLDVVAGNIDPGDTPEDTAFRESREEAGVEIDSLEFICKYFPTCGYSNEILHVYAGITTTPLPDQLVCGLQEEDENIKTHVFKIHDAISLLSSELVLPSPAVISLQWLALNKDRFL